MPYFPLFEGGDTIRQAAPRLGKPAAGGRSVSFPAGTEEFASVCPFLGLADDADSHATYATDAHRCYNLENPTRIATNHQEAYCLGANHVACPVFQGQGIAATGKAAVPAAAAPTSPFDRRPAAQREAPAGRPAARTDGPARTPGALSPRPRSGGISLPVATIGLFALAAVVIGLAFWIQSIVGDDDNQLTPGETLATQQAAASRTGQAGGATTTPGSPTTPGGTRTPGAGSPTAGATTPSGGGQTYTVQPGDSCFGIAQTHGISVEEFMQVNNFTDESCNELQPGQNVRLP